MGGRAGAGCKAFRSIEAVINPAAGRSGPDALAHMQLLREEVCRAARVGSLACVCDNLLWQKEPVCERSTTVNTNTVYCGQNAGLCACVQVLKGHRTTCRRSQEHMCTLKQPGLPHTC